MLNTSLWPWKSLKLSGSSLAKPIKQYDSFAQLKLSRVLLSSFHGWLLIVYQMATRLFALIIGIDSYRAGRIWDLNSCVEDAKRMKQYLVKGLNVPRDQICLLLDRQATKNSIEENFMAHLVNNAAIDKGDAIVIYFAGHGSVIPAPKGWFHSEEHPTPRNVEVLCPYDHDTKQAGGRVAGISDRSMRALIHELSQAKGNNITFIADCCFSPLQTRANTLNRSTTRWTPTVKAKPDDLYSGLWPSARGQPHTNDLGFYNAQTATHIFLAGCGPGDTASEGKDGGWFTSSFLRAVSEITLHRTSYVLLFDSLDQKMSSEGQRPVCLGMHKARIIFNAVPFTVDPRYIPVGLGDDTRPRIEAGAVHGIVKGSEFSLHLHNHRASRNPRIATAVVSEVHPTWSVGRVKCPMQSIPKICWAQITRWNNRPPFRVHLKTTLTSFCKWWKLRNTITAKVDGRPSKTGLNIVRVKDVRHADISLTVGLRNLAVETHDGGVAANGKRVVTIERRDPLDVIDDAARFQLHLHRRNPEYPLRELVSLELFRLDPVSWTREGINLLENGKAIIRYESGAIFSVIIRNNSDIDLWPYLFYMDPNRYGITSLYHPESSTATPPLLRHSHLEIGSGKPGSEALSFSLADHDRFDSGFLKLFFAPEPVAMHMIEQGPTLSSTAVKGTPPFCHDVPDRIWDTISACVQFLRH